MGITWNVRSVLVRLLVGLMVVQMAGASFAQTRMDLAAAGNAAADTIVICTPNGLKTIPWTGGETEPVPASGDCECPVCAFVGAGDLVVVPDRVAVSVAYPVSSGRASAAGDFRHAGSELRHRPDRARAPPRLS